MYHEQIQWDLLNNNDIDVDYFCELLMADKDYDQKYVKQLKG